tara:strand:+ start:451 stop:741 length:291 start_codon:yes stop_codon:yes gene_type:complete
MIRKLIQIFKVKNSTQLIIVFTVFGITGSMSVLVGEYILSFFLGKNLNNNLFYWLLRLILIFPLYQFLLIIVGTIFGEFNYFWRFTKKILSKLKII